nr:GIY-YIG nuclease family protein [Maridesulfovibrio hydrothermalis]
MSTWYVYLLRCKDNSLYCGVTTDPGRRLQEHNAGDGKGARYTRARLPVTLEAVESFPDKVSAYKAEYAVKQKKADRKVEFLRRISVEVNEEHCLHSEF